MRDDEPPAMMEQITAGGRLGEDNRKNSGCTDLEEWAPRRYPLTISLA